MTTERDVTLDLLAALDMYEGLCGSETTTIASVTEGERDSLVLTLSNGDVYDVQIRQRASDWRPALQAALRDEFGHSEKA